MDPPHHAAITYIPPPKRSRRSIKQLTEEYSVEQAASHLLRNRVLCPAEFCREPGGWVADENELDEHHQHVRCKTCGVRTTFAVVMGYDPGDD